MTETEIKTLADEIREDNQVPPFTPDDVIRRSILKCAARLEALRPNADFIADKLGRGYLKDYVYSDMVHRAEEFMQNYGPDIRAWQLEEVIADES